MKKTIAVILADMFEDVEFEKPVKAFREKGCEITIVGLKSERTVKGKSDQTAVHIEKAVDEIEAEQFDALLIPGGYSPDKLRADENTQKFVKAFMDDRKPVFAICHAPQLLISSTSLEGRRLTGWKSVKQDILNAGAEYVDEKVVVDDNLVTSRHPGDIPAFIEAALKKLGL